MQFFIYREEEREKFVGKDFHKRHKNTGVLDVPYLYVASEKPVRIGV